MNLTFENEIPEEVEEFLRENLIDSKGIITQWKTKKAAYIGSLYKLGYAMYSENEGFLNGVKISYF